MPATSARPRTAWTLAIVSLALFMTTLDNLVVSTALPSIRRSLGASIESLEWTVNAYTLSFAVLLLTGAALGDRFGRKRMFVVGLALFTGASAAAALAPTTGALIVARAIQGAGAAVVTPLTLTLLSEAVAPSRRGLALGVWSGVAGLGVAMGPLVGGAVVDGISWHWIFWLNVPVGAVLGPLAVARLRESHGPHSRLDLPGLALAGAGLLGVVFGVVRGNALGWTSTPIVTCIAVGAVLLAAFVAWELRTPAPMLPMRFFRSRAFAATNGVSLAMYFGTFGSVFLLAQFFQTAQGYSPFEAGLRTLPWTAMPMLVAPLAGLLSDRIGSRPLMAAGLALQAGGIALIASVSTPDVAYASLVPGFVMAGTGMALVFAPAANAVLGAVEPAAAGQASGATNAIRELGGVLGVSVLASVFSAHGSYASPAAFTHGVTAAVWVGAAVLAAGALIALLVPGRRALAGAPVAPVAAGEPVAA
jgi:EmrB/QacA subfamily drug resistance transporter